MKKQIRLGVFETNSSSSHTLCIVPKKELERWKNGELLFDSWKDELVEASSVNLEEDEENQFQTYEEWREDEYLEIFVKHYETESGEEIVAFGKYGMQY